MSERETLFAVPDRIEVGPEPWWPTALILALGLAFVVVVWWTS